MSIRAGPSHHWTIQEIPYGSIDCQRARADPYLLYLMPIVLAQKDVALSFTHQSTWRAIMTTLASTSHCSWHLDRRLPLAFVAGFLGVLLFHQPMLGVLHVFGLTAHAPYPMAATVPFGVPRVLSLAFWGGVWALPLALALGCIRPRAAYWLTALLFGAIGPSLVNWLVVLPLKGAPMGGGWHPSAILTALIINGAWGLGTALLLHWTSRRAVRTDRPVGA